MSTYSPALLARNPTAATLVAEIQHGDLGAREGAVRQAPLVGSPAIVALGAVYGGEDEGAARAALEALRRVALHCGRPRAPQERQAAAAALLKLAGPGRPRRVRTEALHLLGVVARPDDVAGLAALLEDEEVREDARMALERVPGRSANAALRKALAEGSAEFRPAVEQSLRRRSTALRDLGVAR
ncbi:MAG: hypothetical protein IT208_10695 [Chthonomonadales bacterium]|nr:hypothetical protein [Chthonomonadales bacterium]